VEGYARNSHFFFGNVGIYTIINGVIVLTDRNVISHSYSTYIRGGASIGDTVVQIGVNCGTSLTGDGVYIGNKKLYQLGFNRLNYAVVDFGAATYMQDIIFNGFIFKLK
jgi:hypothetical protein